MSETLFSTLDESRSVSSKEVARKTGYSLWTVQKYARLGIIPGAFQVMGKGKGSRWRFKKRIVEEWWARQGGTK